MDQALRRGAGAVFGLSGVALFLAGLLHPQGQRGGSFQSTIATYLQDARWPVAHWLALSAAIAGAGALWLLIDTGWTRESVLAQVGGRMLLVALLFMAVEFAVELAGESAAPAYAAGQVVPLVVLTEPMQTIGFPALGLSLAALALGLRSVAPRVVTVLAALGGVVTAVGAVAVEGMHVLAAGPAFAGLALPALWMAWAGGRLVVRSGVSVPEGDGQPVSA